MTEDFLDIIEGYCFEKVAKKYKKKPIIIKAVQLAQRCRIETREGIIYGEVGDFVIKGIEGEFYPCGKEIFFKTYEEAERQENERN